MTAERAYIRHMELTRRRDGTTMEAKFLGRVIGTYEFMGDDVWIDAFCGFAPNELGERLLTGEMLALARLAPGLSRAAGDFFLFVDWREGQVVASASFGDDNGEELERELRAPITADMVAAALAAPLPPDGATPPDRPRRQSGRKTPAKGCRRPTTNQED